MEKRSEKNERGVAVKAIGVRPLGGGGAGVLPYTGYIGTCRGIGYGF